MTKETICLKREVLYEQVWSQPMIELAKHYGLSDVGLAKICRKLKVPLPGRGYWAKRKAGRVPPRPALPTLRKNDLEEIIVTKPELPPAEPQTLTEAEQLIALESLPENLIVVEPVLSTPHPLVARTRKWLHLAKPGKYGLLHTREQGCLAVNVGPSSLGRALRIMDVLIKALEARGHAVTVGAGDRPMTTVTVLGASLEIELRELVTQVPHNLTPAEKADQKHTMLFYAPKYDHHPSGELTLGIKTWCNGIRCKWSDSKRQRLEHCLNAFVVSLIRAAVQKQARERERERQQRQREEERRQQADQERIQREEAARLQALEQEVANWQRAKQIRAYVEAVRQVAEQRDGVIEAGSKMDGWIAWALRQADKIDPLAIR